MELEGEGQHCARLRPEGALAGQRWGWRVAAAGSEAMVVLVEGLGAALLPVKHRHRDLHGRRQRLASGKTAVHNKV